MSEASAAHAAWFVRGRSRWPLVAAVLVGGVLAYLELAHCVRMALARHRLPASVAHLDEVTGPPPPPEQDAAPVWKSVALKGLYSQGFRWEDFRFDGLYWHENESCPADAPIRRYVRANEVAFRMAERAAALPTAYWVARKSPKDPFGLREVWPSHYYGMKSCWPALVLLAAHDGDWVTMEHHLESMAHLAKQRHTGRTALAVYQNYRASRYWLGTVQAILALSPPSPPVEVIRRLRQVASEAARRPLGIAEALSIQGALALAQNDFVASRDYLEARATFGVDSHRFQERFETYFTFAYFLDREPFQRMAARAIECARLAEAGAQGQSDSTQRSPDWLNPICLSLELSDLGNNAAARVAAYRTDWVLAAVLLALREYQQLHAGAWPATLAQAGLAADILRDPFDPDGGNLCYRVNPDGTAEIWSDWRGGWDDRGLSGPRFPLRLGAATPSAASKETAP